MVTEDTVVAAKQPLFHHKKQSSLNNLLIFMLVTEDTVTAKQPLFRHKNKVQNVFHKHIHTVTEYSIASTLP
jgi:hypothetical protein